jgi:hypothetical protein
MLGARRSPTQRSDSAAEGKLMVDTHSRKRDRKGGHAFVCVACDRIALSNRASALTCSSGCRTWLHRHPARLQTLEAMCAPLPMVSPALVQSVEAVKRLRPDLFDLIVAGQREYDDVRAEVYAAALALAAKQAAA